jgi:hypothetical protein
LNRHERRVQAARSGRVAATPAATPAQAAAPRPRVFFAGPSRDGTCVIQYLQSLDATKRDLANEFDFDVTHTPYFICRLLVGQARDAIVGEFFDSGADLLMSVDVDQSWAPETARLLLRAATMTGGLVGAATPMRRVEPDVAKVVHNFSVDQTILPSIEGFAIEGREFWKSGWLGGGMYAITRAALERVASAPAVRRYKGQWGEVAELHVFRGGHETGVWPLTAEVMARWLSPNAPAERFRQIGEDCYFSLCVSAVGLPLHCLVDCPDVCHWVSADYCIRSNVRATARGPINVRLAPPSAVSGGAYTSV